MSKMKIKQQTIKMLYPDLRKGSQNLMKRMTY